MTAVTTAELVGAGFTGLQVATLSTAFGTDNVATPGVAEASKALVVDANKHIDVLKVSASGIAIGATGAETTMTATAAELNTNAGVTAGTVTASKTVVADSAGGISGLGALSSAGGNVGTTIALGIGTFAQPAAGTLTVNSQKFGPFILLNFVLTAAQFAVTDSGGSGSFGTLPLLTFTAAGKSYVVIAATYQQTASTEPGGAGSVTGGAGNDVYRVGIGSTAIAAAANGTVHGTATQDDIIAETANITDVAGTSTGSKIVSVPTTAVAANAINLNWSATAAANTASANFTLTGNINLVLMQLN
jgi:hypothetical protein